jgi:ubiquinone biosynthesis accessory factor UbiJ
VNAPAAALTSALQAAINEILALDAELVEGIAELEGAVLEVHVQGMDKRFQLHASRSGVNIVAVNANDQPPMAVPDVVISGPPFTLVRLLGGLESVDGVLPPDVSIKGDLQLVQKIVKLAKQANIDWEEPLSKLVGDSVAHELGRGLRAFASWASAATDTFAADMGEYLREERRLVPTGLEVSDFSTRIDQARNDIDRLEVRIARLSQRFRSRER